jgi:hypothetical protein
MAKGIFGLLYVLRKLEKQSVDFSKDLINLSRRRVKNKDRFRENKCSQKKFPALIAVEILAAGVRQERLQRIAG